MNLLLGLLLFVGLPIVGWGISDIAGFFRQPARLYYVISFVTVQIVLVILIPGIGQNRGEGHKTVGRQRIAVLFLQLIPLALVIIAPWSDHQEIATIGASVYTRYLGLVLFLIGFVGMHWAEAVIDRQFSVQVTIQDNHQLITHGPYRFIRHPRYLGILLFTSGIALIFRSWIGLLLSGVLLIVLFWRIHDEESLMQQEFGIAWENYTSKSWRMIPFVY